MTKATGQPAMLEAVAATIDCHQLIAQGASVVVAVSGGIDSVAMLSVLRELSSHPSRGYRLIVAHLNHGLRGAAAQDAAFVRELAEAWGLPFVGAERDVRAHAAASGQSVEQAGRALRYEFLLDAAQGAGAACVTVGHHADDNAETVLYRILRGTSLHGLRGIEIRRPLLGREVELVRPLLKCRRSDIEDYCREAKLSWREDASNADTNYRRNFIRHELLPSIAENLNPRADEALLRLAEHASEIDAFMIAQAKALLTAARLPARPDDGGMGSLPVRVPPVSSFDAARLASANPAVQAFALREILEQAGVPMRTIGFAQLHELRKLLAPACGMGVPPMCDTGILPVSLDVSPSAEQQNQERQDTGGTPVERMGKMPMPHPKAISLGRGLVARRDGDRFSVGPAPLTDAAPEVCETTLAVNSTAALSDGRQFSCRVEPFDQASFAEHLEQAHMRPRAAQPAPIHAGHVEMLDADQLRGTLRIRPRRQGDAFRPLGASGGKSVSDFLTDLKLPAPARRDVLCLCDHLGIVCVWPLRIDQRVRVTSRTSRTLRISESR